MNNYSQDLLNKNNNDKLYVISKSGSGNILVFSITSGILSRKYYLEQWRPITYLKEFACVSYKSSIFIVGGYCIKTKKCSGKIMKYNICTNEWFDLSLMNNERRLCSAVVYNDEIYVCGGIKSNGKMQSTCEIYSILRNKWRKGPSFRHPKADVQLCVLCGNDSIIAVGGLVMGKLNDKPIVHSSDEILEYKGFGGWNVLDDEVPIKLGKPSYRHSISVLNNRLYIVGGLRTMLNPINGNLSEEQNCVMESFLLTTPSTSALETAEQIREWISPWNRALSAPIISRHGAALVNFGRPNCFYLIGGSLNCCSTDGDRSGVTFIEKFHVTTNTWTKYIKINEEVDISTAAAVVINARSDSSTSLYQYDLETPNSTESSFPEFQQYKVGWILW